MKEPLDVTLVTFSFNGDRKILCFSLGNVLSCNLIIFLEILVTSFI